MSNVAVIVDSVACLTDEMIEQYKINVMPLNFLFKGERYRDWVDVTPSQAYELFLEDPDSFKTSSVSPGEALEAFRETAKLAKDIFCVTVSSKISAVYSSAVNALKLAETELPHNTIELMDSCTCAAAEGFIALAAARTAAGGGDLAEVVKAAEDIKERVNFYVFLDTVRHVYRSGRIPKIASQAGSVLNIKPILTTSSGVLRFVGIARSKKSGLEKMLSIMREKAGQEPVHVAVVHAYAPEEARQLERSISNDFNWSELWISEFSPLMGYACGTGALGIAFYIGD